jgi:hypothetical protein
VSGHAGVVHSDLVGKRVAPKLAARGGGPWLWPEAVGVPATVRGFYAVYDCGSSRVLLVLEADDGALFEVVASECVVLP